MSNYNPYIQHTPSSSSSPEPGKRDRMWDALGRCGKMLEGYGKMAGEAVENVWHHIRVSPSIGDVAKARLVQGTKLLAEGGPERLFQHTFGVIPEEKYLHSYACYLATPSGPVNGTLYISTKRLAFCSESPLCYPSSPGQSEWLYYKVVIELNRVANLRPSPNLLNPSEKDIHVVTKDGHEFWFLGFISFSRALKSLTEALKRSCS
ncbi:GEM-like protein 2 [Benincasa hispida]|uniref:GEM-like protein 2 n=1 Tax=Benincasa hispida TaxID=102211 RepID=UPI0019005735|nr:GEM-like protein 2 [Benincasa hispida]XP_038887657.1 GEM-like protein 2 [Benincasa hispida]